MLTLYYAPRLSSMPAHIALEESGAVYEAKAVDLEKGEQRTREFLAINPRARVPVLTVDGQPLTESVAILGYIARRFPQARLLPADPLAEARCIAMSAWFSTTVQPAFSHCVRAERYAADPAAQPSVSETGRKTFWGFCREIDSLLAEKTWLMGEQYTICDGGALLFYWWGVRIRLPMHELTHFTAHKARMVQRPAVRSVLQRERSPLLDSSLTQ